MANNDTAPLWAWLKENLMRMGMKTPKFFVVWTWIGGFAAFICGLPAMLDEVGIVVPEPWQSLQSKIVGIAGVIVMIWSKLPVEKPVIDKQTMGNDVINRTVTDSRELPFTAQNEKKPNT